MHQWGAAEILAIGEFITVGAMSAGVANENGYRSCFHHISFHKWFSVDEKQVPCQTAGLCELFV